MPDFASVDANRLGRGVHTELMNLWTDVKFCMRHGDTIGRGVEKMSQKMALGSQGDAHGEIPERTLGFGTDMPLGCVDFDTPLCHHFGAARQ